MKKTRSVFTIFFILLFLSAAGAGTVSADQKEQKEKGSKLININTADIDQLVKLPRVGERTAERIIEFRTKHGKFKTIQGIMKVKGIGEKTFKRMEKLITV